MPIREYSFLNNTRVAAADREDVVELHVDGARDETLGAGNGSAGRVVRLRPGANYAEAKARLSLQGAEGAFLVRIGARSLELLCEDLGSPPENHKFNEAMGLVFGVAEQVLSLHFLLSKATLFRCQPGE